MTDSRDLIQQLADAYAYCIDKYMTAPSEEDSLVSKARAYLENTKPQEQISEEENERRFKEAMRIINSTTHEQLVELMGEEWLEEFRRVSQ